MRFKNFDLNLLVALDILLEERHVSAAAKRLNLSQSAMSNALGRLRDHFQDPLLVPAGRSMIATAYAQSLAGPVRDLLRQAEATVGEGLHFDPLTTQRRFSVVASDYVIDVLLTNVLRRIAELAPGLKMDIRFQGSDVPTQQIVTGEVDLVIAPDYICPPDHPKSPLFEDEFVVVGWSGNTALMKPLDVEAFVALPQVAVRFDRSRAVLLPEQFCRSLGFEISVELVAPGFTTVPGLLVGTSRVSLLPRRLAERYVALLPLVIARTDFVGPSISEMMLYNRVRANDAGLSWLRNTIADEARMSATPELWHKRSG